LAYGELALNYADGALYYKRSDNTVQNLISTNTGTGTVTSVSGTGTVSGLTLTGTVTTTGSLTLGGTLSLTSGNVTTALGFTPYNATNPSGYITSSGTAANVSGTVAIANGGTGATTRQAAMDALAGAVTSGQYLRGDGTDVVMSAIQAADVPTLNQNTTGSAATLTTARTIALTGDVTYTSDSFNGSANVTGTATLANSGVSAGTYGSATNIPQIAVDAKGRITSVSNVAVSIPSGSLTFTGDVTGTGTTGSSTALTLAAAGTAGTYTKVTTDSKGRVTSGTTLAATDIPNLDAAKITSGTIDAARLPSYVDDVVEAANLAGFPATGETGKIYVALDTNKTYRWSGSAYIFITSGAVDSVAGKTGVVTLVKADVGLGNVDNTADSAKPVSTAQQTALDLKANLASPTFTGTVGGITAAMVGLGNVNNTADSAKSVASAATLTTARTIGGVSFNGSADINLPGVNAAGNQNTTGTAANVTGTVAVANGGTGQTTYTNGQLLIGNTTGNTLAKATLTQGTGISITNGAGAITITNSAPDQTVALTGAGGTSITGTYPNFTITSTNTTYGLATSTVLGLIELGSDTQQTVAANAVTATASRSYALQVNAAGQGVVNVPWTDSGGTVTSVGGTGTVSGLTLTGTVTGSGNLTLGGTLSLTSSNITTALGFTPYNSTNPSGYITNSTNTFTTTGAVTLRSGGDNQLSLGGLNDITLGGTGHQGVITIGRSTLSENIDIGAAAHTALRTKTINIGTGGAASSITTIAIGATTGTTVAANGTWTYTNTIVGNINGTAANVTGTVAIANGGTGATTAAVALTNLGAYAASNPSAYIDTNGTARTIVENNGTIVGTRRALNFIPGSGITLNIVDDAANEEVDITITAGASAPVRRVVALADSSTLTVNASTTDLATQTNTQAVGTLTIAAPTGTPTDGQQITIRLTVTNTQNFVWDPVFAGSVDLPLPVSPTSGGKIDYLGFVYSTAAAKWHLIAKNFGF
jgi:hypothetical protein